MFSYEVALLCLFEKQDKIPMRGFCLILVASEDISPLIKFTRDNKIACSARAHHARAVSKCVCVHQDFVCGPRTVCFSVGFSAVVQVARASSPQL